MRKESQVLKYKGNIAFCRIETHLFPGIKKNFFTHSNPAVVRIAQACNAAKNCRLPSSGMPQKNCYSRLGRESHIQKKTVVRSSITLLYLHRKRWCCRLARGYWECCRTHFVKPPVRWQLCQMELQHLHNL